MVRGPVIVLEHPAESFPTPNLARWCDFMALDRLVPQTLVRSFGMIMIHVF